MIEGSTSAGSILVGSNLVLNLSVSDLNVFPISSTFAPVNVPVGTVLGPSEKSAIFGAALIVSKVPSKFCLALSISFLAASISALFCNLSSSDTDCLPIAKSLFLSAIAL